ncbi:hypothetical protein QFZ31_002417 [Neobacillus niacini]|jgi:hypothetical protein|nr:hypothetical protein [Neobacillus niacini]
MGLGKLLNRRYDRGMITFKNGASFLLETAFAANVEKADEMNVTLMGVKGEAVKISQNVLVV